MLAGLVAGGLTASTAFSTGPVARTPRTEQAAMQVAETVPPFFLRPAGPLVGALRVQEAAIAEWEYRRTAPTAASRSAGAPTPAAPGTFVRPASGAVTGAFGESRGSRTHPGTDIDGETGDPVLASQSGIVSHAGPAPAGFAGYGTIVLIDHGNGITTLSAHLSRVSVRTGDPVAAGDVVGAIGTTGNITGSHLHYELRLGDRSVNPSTWFRR